MPPKRPQKDDPQRRRLPPVSALELDLPPEYSQRYQNINYPPTYGGSGHGAVLHGSHNGHNSYTGFSSHSQTLPPLQGRTQNSFDPRTVAISPAGYSDDYYAPPEAGFSPFLEDATFRPIDSEYDNPLAQDRENPYMGDNPDAYPPNPPSSFRRSERPFSPVQDALNYRPDVTLMQPHPYGAYNQHAAYSAPASARSSRRTMEAPHVPPPQSYGAVNPHSLSGCGSSTSSRSSRRSTTHGHIVQPTARRPLVSSPLAQRSSSSVASSPPSSRESTSSNNTTTDRTSLSGGSSEGINTDPPALNVSEAEFEAWVRQSTKLPNGPLSLSRFRDPGPGIAPSKLTCIRNFLTLILWQARRERRRLRYCEIRERLQDRFEWYREAGKAHREQALRHALSLNSCFFHWKAGKVPGLRGAPWILYPRDGTDRTRKRRRKTKAQLEARAQAGYDSDSDSDSEAEEEEYHLPQTQNIGSSSNNSRSGTTRGRGVQRQTNQRSTSSNTDTSTAQGVRRSARNQKPKSNQDTKKKRGA